jgi:uncharacterized membrane protein YphA (DoxX/SURF4 family)
MIQDLNHPIAMATVRILLGVLFAFQGYDKIFRVGVDRVRETMQMGLGESKLPPAFINITATITSWIEFICGLLLIAGFLKYYALYLICVNMLVVAIGFSIARPMWENAHIFFRLTLLLILMLTPPEWDIFNVDYLITLFKLKS